jgi:hypothetical protein
MQYVRSKSSFTALQGAEQNVPELERPGEYGYKAVAASSRTTAAARAP